MKKIILFFVSIFTLHMGAFSQNCFGTLHWTVDTVCNMKSLYLPSFQLNGETFVPKDTIWPIFTITNITGKNYGETDSMNLVIRCAVFNEKGDTLFLMDFTKKNA